MWLSGTDLSFNACSLTQSVALEAGGLVVQTAGHYEVIYSVGLDMSPSNGPVALMVNGVEVPNSLIIAPGGVTSVGHSMLILNAMDRLTIRNRSGGPLMLPSAPSVAGRLSVKKLN